MTPPLDINPYLVRLQSIIGVEPPRFLEGIQKLYQDRVIDRRHYISLSSLIEEGNFITSVNLLYPLAFSENAAKIFTPLDYSNKLDILKTGRIQGLFAGFKDPLEQPVTERLVPFYRYIKLCLNALSTYQLGTIESPPAFVAPTHLTSALKWEQLDQYDPGRALFTLRLLTNNLPANRDAAKKYLTYLTEKHLQELREPYSECRKSNLLMEIAYLDRVLNQETGSYITPLAKAQLNRWINEKTANGRDHGFNEFILEEETARTFFIRYPKTYEWIIETRLHRNASTFNHQWIADANGDLLIPTSEGPKPATSLMESVQLINNRLTDLNSGEILSYGQDGLNRLETPLTPFKIKERKSKDWRLEIASDTGEDSEGHDHNHSFAYLKSPDGKVYSFGKLPDNDIDTQLEINNSFQTLPSYLKFGDVSDFLPRIKSNKNPKANIKVTKIDLGSEENFNKALDFIKSYDADFNLIDNNCGAVPSGLCHLFDIHPKNKVTIPSLLTPLTLEQRKFFVIHSWIQVISLILFYPLILISHIAIAVLGGFGKHPFSKGKPLFTNFFQIFDPRKSLIDYPLQLRAWQEVVEDRLGKGVYSLKQIQGR